MGEVHYNIALLADAYGALLTERQLDFIRDYYDFDLSYAEIAQKHGLARQSVKDAVAAAQDNLREYEQKLGLVERLGGIRRLLEDAAALSGDDDGLKGKIIEALKLL